MSAPDLVKRIFQQMENGELDWRRTREEIVAEHGNATTTAERVLCLGLHKAVMDAWSDKTSSRPKWPSFRSCGGYNSLLISEAMIGKTDDHLDPVVVKAITDREVAADRMAENDELRKLIGRKYRRAPAVSLAY